MKFSCDKAVLSAAISNVSRAVTTRTALQALEGILIRAEGDTLTLTGYDLKYPKRAASFSAPGCSVR